jgi:hypothetical protein
MRESMAKRRVFVSMPAAEWLSNKQNAIKEGIVRRIQALQLDTEAFFPHVAHGLSGGKPWNEENFDKVISRCVGAVIIGLPRHTASFEKRKKKFASEYAHYEGAVANTHDLPMLVFADEDVDRRGVFHGGKHVVVKIPRNADEAWLKGREFDAQFKRWHKQILGRSDVFLGYCSRGSDIARAVKRYLAELGVSALDWKSDFPPGGTILESIQDAASKCTAGIFLFTHDDAIKKGTRTQMAPRDNVIFEAGFFCHAKGKERVLVVVEEGTKMPSDLGGNIYASLPRRPRRKKHLANIDPIKPTLLKFIRERI